MRSGAMVLATFDNDLGKILKAGNLGANHAVEVTATGELAGHIYLVIDANNTAGYQLGPDYVIEPTSPSAASLALKDFI